MFSAEGVLLYSKDGKNESFLSGSVLWTSAVTQITSPEAKPRSRVLVIIMTGFRGKKHLRRSWIITGSGWKKKIQTTMTTGGVSFLSIVFSTNLDVCHSHVITRHSQHGVQAVHWCLFQGFCLIFIYLLACFSNTPSKNSKRTLHLWHCAQMMNRWKAYLWWTKVSATIWKCSKTINKGGRSVWEASIFCFGKCLIFGEESMTLWD